MTAITKKIGGYTAEELKNNTIIKGIQFIAKREEGIEIVDRRSLADRFSNEIKGCGVKRCFGTTHFIVTENLYKKITNA
jgi:hypothetical protein